MDANTSQPLSTLHDPSAPPPLLAPEDTPPIRSTSDLYRHWRALMGPLGFGSRQLWLLFLDAGGRASGVLPCIEALPELPSPGNLAKLIAVISGACGATMDGGSVAVLLARPGRARITTADRFWIRGLMSRAEEAGLTLQPVFLATDEALFLVDRPSIAA